MPALGIYRFLETTILIADRAGWARAVKRSENFKHGARSSSRAEVCSAVLVGAGVTHLCRPLRRP